MQLSGRVLTYHEQCPQLNRQRGGKKESRREKEGVEREVQLINTRKQTKLY